LLLSAPPPPLMILLFRKYNIGNRGENGSMDDADGAIVSK
jgi:hypothetical protein